MSDDLPDDPTAVRETYERIAADFDRTRSAPWPAIVDFAGSLGRVELSLDVGCGNGRHLPVLAGTSERVVGVDASRAMLETARPRAGGSIALLEAAADAVPLGDDRADAAIYVATMHHLGTATARVRSLDELGRVLRPDGVGLVGVWSVAHERFDATAAFDGVVDWTLPDGTTVPRYYHIYDPEGFDDELARSTVHVLDRWTEAGNLYAVVTPRGE